MGSRHTSMGSSPALPEQAPLPPCDYAYPTATYYLLSSTYMLSLWWMNDTKYPACPKCGYNVSAVASWERTKSNRDVVRGHDAFGLGVVEESTLVASVNATIDGSIDEFTLRPLQRDGMFMVFSKTKFGVAGGGVDYEPRSYILHVRDPFGINWCRVFSANALSPPSSDQARQLAQQKNCLQRNETITVKNGEMRLEQVEVRVDVDKQTTMALYIFTHEVDLRCVISLRYVRFLVENSSRTFNCLAGALIVGVRATGPMNTAPPTSLSGRIAGGFGFGAPSPSPQERNFEARVTVKGVFPEHHPYAVALSLTKAGSQSPYVCMNFTQLTQASLPFGSASSINNNPEVVYAHMAADGHPRVAVHLNNTAGQNISLYFVGVYEPNDSTPSLGCVWKIRKNGSWAVQRPPKEQCALGIHGDFFVRTNGDSMLTLVFKSSRDISHERDLMMFVHAMERPSEFSLIRFHKQTTPAPTTPAPTTTHTTAATTPTLTAPGPTTPEPTVPEPTTPELTTPELDTASATTPATITTPAATTLAPTTPGPATPESTTVSATTSTTAAPDVTTTVPKTSPDSFFSTLFDDGSGWLKTPTPATFDDMSGSGWLEPRPQTTNAPSPVASTQASNPSQKPTPTPHRSVSPPVSAYARSSVSTRAPISDAVTVLASTTPAQVRSTTAKNVLPESGTPANIPTTTKVGGIQKTTLFFTTYIAATSTATPTTTTATTTTTTTTATTTTTTTAAPTTTHTTTHSPTTITDTATVTPLPATYPSTTQTTDSQATSSKPITPTISSFKSAHTQTAAPATLVPATLAPATPTTQSTTHHAHTAITTSVTSPPPTSHPTRPPTVKLTTRAAATTTTTTTSSTVALITGATSESVTPDPTPSPSPSPTPAFPWIWGWNGPWHAAFLETWFAPIVAIFVVLGLIFIVNLFMCWCTTRAAMGRRKINYQTTRF
ncbi:envelope glycoprotein [Eptesicus fuscus gammaherpesvirus]|uniref:Envelope glycoprotein n=1 Tax=vespertilionid gammaherpesvirus 3 TaxID=2846598 RepID=A0A2D0ZXC6_9GAMA|nr:envelope glycoprotein [Eptesicus fuscus gammaherpesvirus]ATA58281.1 envelope glycoprotein [Eptesicus fuscus gammaherpesvirus]WAH70890.1 envelope glycoprotein [Eptesicus fuscus gammaherpesvirus]